jgi:hypothetical protein
MDSIFSHRKRWGSHLVLESPLEVGINGRGLELSGQDWFRHDGINALEGGLLERKTRMSGHEKMLHP